MAHTKAQGSSTNGRDSQGQRLGVGVERRDQFEPLLLEAPVGQQRGAQVARAHREQRHYQEYRAKIAVDVQLQHGHR